jgi:hypothetical protein
LSLFQIYKYTFKQFQGCSLASSPIGAVLKVSFEN